MRKLRFGCAGAALAAMALHGRLASAQQRPQTWCVPGTPLCVQGTGSGSGSGTGNAGAGASGGAGVRVGPGGVQGYAGARGSGSAGASGSAQGQASGTARGQVSGGGSAQGQGSGGVQGQGGGSAQGQGGGDAQSGGGGGVQSDGGGEGDTGSSGSSPPGGYNRQGGHSGSPLALGMAPCLVARIGIWFGYRGGACFGFGLRGWSGVGFDLDFVILGGGDLPTLDLLLRPTLVVPLAGTTPYFDQLSLRIGSTMVGGSVPLEGSKGYMRFGGSIGLGYDVSLSDTVNWRVLDANFYAEVRVGTRRAAYMDREGHSWDLGLMVSTGFFFHSDV